MPIPTRKGIFIVLLAIFLVVGVAVIPDIISEEMRAWCLNTFGEGYQGYLLGFFVVGSIILLFLTTDIGNWLRPGAGAHPTDRSPGTPDPDLVAKVRKYLNERYSHRLSQKLAGRQPVNLRILPSKTGTSKEGAENYMTLQEEEVRAAIGDIFNRANGRLLLVGLPGSGKTTLVLQLALFLLERPGNAMPVVLNLATWRSEFKTFEEWLKKILPTELGATPALAEQIRKNTPLILLLDGLDEVPAADRDSLLAGIGEYGADANRQFLISSRIAEYAATKDAPVNAQIEVAPLTVEQVEKGLAATANIQPESRRLLNALKSDPLMRSAVENPFYLNTAQLLFSTGKNWSDFGFVAQDVAGRQRELVDRFVEGALGRTVQQDYPADKALHWISFLASRMTERNMVVFELRDLQYDWWKWHKSQLVLNGGIFGINLVLAYGLIIGIVFGFALGLLGGLGYQFFDGLSVEMTGLPAFKISGGPTLGLIIGLVTGLVFGLVFALIAGLGAGLNEGLKGESLPIHTVDSINWSWKSLIQKFKNNLSGKAGEDLVIWLFRFVTESIDILQINTPYQRFIASAKNLHFSILQHLILRYQLYRAGLLPLRLVTFLNELSLRHILEFDGDPETGKGGGSWRFRHRILQDYFTAKYFAENTSKGTLEELVEEHLFDDNWHEVFLLVTRMLPNAEKLLFLMLEKNQILPQGSELNQLLRSATKSLLTGSSIYTPLVRKAAAIYIMLYRCNNKSLDRAIYEAFDLAQELAFHHNLDNKTAGLQFAFSFPPSPTNVIYQCVVDGTFDFELNLDTSHQQEFVFTEKSIENISIFLKSNALIARSLSAAGHISDSTRDYILEQMLTPLTKSEPTQPSVT